MKTGRGPIKVRVICKSATDAKRQSSAAMLSLMERKAEEYRISLIANGV
jgi:hypothetical protein